MMESIVDVFIIGGGINGTGIASDAAGRGLSVTLCEKNDLASGTSSCSTKLIHGGLRYLEYGEFNLVRKALREREILMKNAPHLITPLEFVLPYSNQLRPAWLIRFGLFLYDHLVSRKTIPGSSSIKLASDIRGRPLLRAFKKGFSYYDCFTDDARLVIENAISAKNHGAEILTQTEFLSAEKENHHWKISLKDKATNTIYLYYAKALINSAGPWIQEINQKIVNTPTSISIQLVKGSHIIIPKLYEGNFAYLLQNQDKRIIFAIPYQQQFTLIGTTDIRVNTPLSSSISAEEKQYLCQSINQYFNKSISEDDIIWSYSGIRCLQDQDADPSAITRDYKLLLSENNSTPLLTVLGGKITTFRELAEEALNKLKTFFPHMGPAWTAQQPLPGGNMDDFDAFYQEIKTIYSWLPEEISYRYAKNYGTRMHLILKDIHSEKDLGKQYCAGLYEVEINYLIQHEWAQSIEDILWRRTKLGLYTRSV